MAVIVAAISAFYRLILGHLPDWMGYLEYAMLYGGGADSDDELAAAYCWARGNGEDGQTRVTS